NLMSAIKLRRTGMMPFLAGPARRSSSKCQSPLPAKPNRTCPAGGVAQRVEMRDAAIVGNGDLAIQHHCRHLGIHQRPEGLSEEPRAVIPIAAEQHKLAVTRKDGD